MGNYNKLNEVPLANMSEEQLEEIKQLEQKFDGRYYLIAFDKENENDIM